MSTMNNNGQGTHSPQVVHQNGLQKLVSDYKNGNLSVLELKQALQAMAQPSPDLPLSEGQKGLYFLQKTDAVDTVYNVPLCIGLPGFEKTLGTGFCGTTGAISGVNVAYSRKRCRVATKSPRSKSIFTVVVALDNADHAHQIRQEVKFVFGFEDAPLYRITVFLTANNDAFLLINFHHLIIDGISSFIVLKQLLSNYRHHRCVTRQSPAVRTFDAFVHQEKASLAAGPLFQTFYWRITFRGLNRR